MHIVSQGSTYITGTFTDNAHFLGILGMQQGFLLLMHIKVATAWREGMPAKVTAEGMNGCEPYLGLLLGRPEGVALGLGYGAVVGDEDAVKEVALVHGPDLNGHATHLANVGQR